MAENEAVEVARKFLREVRLRGISVVEAYLFGSHVRGTAGDWSDIDIALVCHPFAEDRTEQNIILWKIAVKIDPRLAPLTLSPDDLDKTHIPLIPEIKKGLPLIRPAA